MMKRFLAILLSLCLILSMVPAVAETTDASAQEEEGEKGVALNPYTSEGLSVTIALPSNVQVTNEEYAEGSTVMTLALDGRTDVGYTMSVTYNEKYAEYTMIDLPEDLRQEMIDYYAENFPGDTPPSFMDITDMDEFSQYFMPFFASGVSTQDGNLYVIYVCICRGLVFTVSSGIAAKEFDVDAYGTAYNLYWQGVDMFYEFLVSMGVFEE